MANPKIVPVCAYMRWRFGKWESVIHHFRSWPNR